MSWRIPLELEIRGMTLFDNSFIEKKLLSGFFSTYGISTTVTHEGEFLNDSMLIVSSAAVDQNKS